MINNATPEDLKQIDNLDKLLENDPRPMARRIGCAIGRVQEIKNQLTWVITLLD